METAITKTSKTNTAIAKRLSPITEIPVDLSPELGINERQIVYANRCFPKAIDCDKALFVKELQKIIEKCIKDTGFKLPEDTDMAETVFAVADDIYREFYTMTIPEVEIAFRKGIRNEYGEFFGLSTVSFYKFLHAYHWQTRNEAMVKQRKFEEEQEQKSKVWKPTPQEEKVFTFFSISSLIKSIYAKEQVSLDSRNITYKALTDLKIVQAIPDDDYREKIWKQAFKAISDRINNQIKTTKASLQKQELRNVLVLINNPQQFDKGDAMIAAEARLIHTTNCIKDYIKGQKQEIVLSEIKTKLLGKLSGDELIWEAWRLKIRKPNELFKSKKYHDAFLERTEKLREQKPMRP